MQFFSETFVEVFYLLPCLPRVRAIVTSSLTDIDSKCFQAMALLESTLMLHTLEILPCKQWLFKCFCRRFLNVSPAQGR